MVKYILEEKLILPVKKMYLNEISTPDGKITAACDKELLGKKFTEGKYSLDLEKNAGFYKGKLCTEKEVKKALKGAFTINLTGENAVQTALDEGMAEKGAVKKIAGIPHLQIYRIK